MRDSSLPIYTRWQAQVTKDSEEGHLLLVARNHLTDFVVRSKGVCHAGQTLPGLARLGQCHEPHSVTAVAENAANCIVHQDNEVQGSRGKSTGTC